MGISPLEYLQMQERLKPKAPAVRSPEPPAEREVGRSGLHQQIMDFCAAQRPPWEYAHLRTDKPSTGAIGLEDFIIVAPGGRYFSIECKARSEKRTQAQNLRALRYDNLGHTIYLVRNMADFKAICCGPSRNDP